jgi:dihydrofolate reductase
MATDSFSITVHMVSSLDGYIARKDNSISWFETTDSYENGTAAPDVTAFLKRIDCYVMGSKTYELALELSKSYGWAYGDIPTIVLTHRNLPVERPNIETWSGNLHKLVNEKLKPKYRNVWMVGGAELCKDFIRLNLADQIRQSILPILLGSGTPFFYPTEQERPLHLKNVTAYKNGIVELWYEIKK